MKHPYLTTRADSTRYYFRRKAPLALRPLLDQTVVQLSLQTPCGNEAISNTSSSSPQHGSGRGDR